MTLILIPGDLITPCAEGFDGLFAYIYGWLTPYPANMRGTNYKTIPNGEVLLVITCDAYEKGATCCVLSSHQKTLFWINAEKANIKKIF